MKILLLPLGTPDREILLMLRNDLGRRFSASIAIGEEVPVPANAWNPERSQYAAEAIVQVIVKQPGPAEYNRLLGISGCDLYVPGLNFVFGVATGDVALISLFRLRQEFYGLPGDPALFHRRALTEAVHELGHTFLLDHCQDPGCVMHFSNSLADTDRKGPEFCTRCHSGLPRHTGMPRY
jgi:archaemetzincin